MPQLDGLRAFAVFGVLIQHFLSFEMPGFLGVRLFFVLSGFLITGLLLDSRNLVESGLSTYGEQLKRFYARRMLRLYPPLLVFIAVCLVLDLGRMRSDWPWHATYLSNVYLIFIRPRQNLFPVHILWTLSIEEQFYLAWPLFILFAPRRYFAK